MPIITVKMKPPDKWCGKPIGRPAVWTPEHAGTIDTDRMFMAQCPNGEMARCWPVLKYIPPFADAKEGDWVCEHNIEIGD